jgi:hypothetical protein
LIGNPWSISGSQQDGGQIHNMVALPPNRVQQEASVARLDSWRAAACGVTTFVRWNYLLASPGYVVLLTNYTGSNALAKVRARHPVRSFLSLRPRNQRSGDEAIRCFVHRRNQQLRQGQLWLANWLRTAIGALSATLGSSI